MVLTPSSSRSGPYFAPLYFHEPARKLSSTAFHWWVHISIVINAYSAMARVWPKALQIAARSGTQSKSTRS